MNSPSPSTSNQVQLSATKSIPTGKSINLSSGTKRFDKHITIEYSLKAEKKEQMSYSLYYDKRNILNFNTMNLNILPSTISDTVQNGVQLLNFNLVENVELVFRKIEHKPQVSSVLNHIFTLLQSFGYDFVVLDQTMGKKSFLFDKRRYLDYGFQRNDLCGPFKIFEIN